MRKDDQAVLGLYNIICGICGCKVKSNQIKIGAETGLPQCYFHPEENYQTPRMKLPLEPVPEPSQKPVEIYPDIGPTYG